MSLQELLNELAQKNVQLSIDGDNLKIRAAKNSLSEQNRLKIAEYKEEIIKLFKQASQEQEIKAVSRKQPLPLSFEQERLWLAHQFTTQVRSYNLVQAIQINGNIELNILEKSINNILNRHEILQTTFAIQAGKVNPVINNFSYHLLIEYIQFNQITQIVDEEAQKSFKLENNPLWRFRFLKSEDKLILIIVFHHLISDILSISIFLKELAQVYHYLITQDALNLPHLSIQYADFAAWQREEIKTDHLQNQLYFWQTELQKIPKSLDLPYEQSCSNLTSHGEYQNFYLSRELWLELKQFSQQQATTPATVLLAIFYLLLYRISQQQDIIIGYPTSGRFQSQLKSLIGFFAYPLPFRLNLNDSWSFQELLQKISQKNLEIIKNQNVPFSQILEKVESKAELFQVLFSTFLGQDLNTITTPELTLKLLPDASRTPTDLDLLWSLYEVDEELWGVIGYQQNLFQAETIQELIQSYYHLVEQCLVNHEWKLNQFKLTESLERKVNHFHQFKTKPKLVITATFTAEPIRESIQFWLNKLDLPYQLEFTAYNQVFQQLLDIESLINQNKNGINCVLIRLEDWVQQNDLENAVQDFLNSIQKYIHHNLSPLLVCLCPASTKLHHSIEDLERLSTELLNINGVSVIKFSDFQNLYNLQEYEDETGNELGHIPYTSDFFVSLGTMLVRRIDALRRKPYKVIALDCDQTLWHGVCGEQSIEEIAINQNYSYFHDFLIEQKNQGMLLCICSKNNEQDVKKVFEQHPNIKLKWSDFVAFRINWQDKSSNLKSLSQELNLGLDSFILIDDNPVECAEVKTHCPEVVTIQLSENSIESNLIKHFWIFDPISVTLEDQKRTNFYQENIQRQKVLVNSLTLANFINSLNLQVKISEVTTENLSRVAQLTQRTNQFNTTTIRRTDAEILNLQKNGYQCLTVDVKDKFGDYGLVGLMIYCESFDSLEVDSFLLSCRALGRGVEYQMLAKLGKIALSKNLEWVKINYRPSEKNQPVLNFLQRVGQGSQNQSGFAFKSNYLSQVTYEPDSQITPTDTTHTQNQIISKSSVNSNLYLDIATNLATLEQIKDAIASTFKKTYTRQDYLAPRNQLEADLATIWTDFLKVEQIGMNDNFFELGGDSILMIQIVARLKQEGFEITPIQFYEHQTIAELASLIQGSDTMAPHLDLHKNQPELTNLEDSTSLDFSDVDLSQEELDHLLSSLE